MKNLGTITMETDRLILRKFKITDGIYMYENWASDEKVTKYLSWPIHMAKSMSESYVKWVIKSYEKDNEGIVYDWVIELKEIGEPIGSIGAVNVNNDVESVQIGYCIGHEWWNMGIASEAFDEIIKFFMEYVGVNRIEARCDSRNLGSKRVMEKCGLKYEGTMRDGDKNNSGICDILWYSMLKTDYDTEYKNK